MQGYHKSSASSSHRGPPLTYAPLGLQHRAPARCSPRTPVLVSPGTPTRRPAPPGGPMLLCALAPCSLFRHTMATLVALFISFLCAPSSGGCLCCLCSSVCQHPGLPPPPQAPCGHRPPAPFSPQPTMLDRSTPSPDTPSPAPDTSLGGAIRRGQGGYITPCRLGVPTASKRRAQSEAAHKWARWLHNPCRLGGPHRFTAGGRIRGALKVGKVAT